MSLNIPKVITGFIVNNDPAQRLFNGLCNAVNPVINFLNGAFTANADNSLSILKPLNVTNLNASGNANIQGNAVIVGTVNAQGQVTFTGGLSSAGTNVMPGTLVIQTVKGAQGGLLVQGNAAVLGSLSSSTGFKTQWDMGVAWISNAVAGTFYRTKRYSQNDNASNQFNAGTLCQVPFSGSIVGISAYSSGTQSGSATINVYQDVPVGAGVPSQSPVITYPNVAASQYYGSYISYPKGQYPVAAGDYMQTAVSFSVAGNQFMQVNLWFEFSA